MSRLRTNIITNRMANGAPTVSNGLVISGVTTTSEVNVGAGVTLNVYGGATFSGIVTASSFSGNGDFVELDVDGHTNLDNVSIAGVTTFSSNINVTGSGSFTKTSNNYILVGSSNAGGASLVLDGDSNGDGSGTDYAYIEHDSSGNLNIVGDNPANASNIIFKTNSSTERLRITSTGVISFDAGTTAAVTPSQTTASQIGDDTLTGGTAWFDHSGTTDYYGIDGDHKLTNGATYGKIVARNASVATGGTAAAAGHTWYLISKTVAGTMGQNDWRVETVAGWKMAWPTNLAAGATTTFYMKDAVESYGSPIIPATGDYYISWYFSTSQGRGTNGGSYYTDASSGGNVYWYIDQDSSNPNQRIPRQGDSWTGNATGDQMHVQYHTLPKADLSGTIFTSPLLVDPVIQGTPLMDGFPMSGGQLVKDVQWHTNTSSIEFMNADFVNCNYLLFYNLSGGSGGNSSNSWYETRMQFCNQDGSFYNNTNDYVSHSEWCASTSTDPTTNDSGNERSGYARSIWLTGNGSDYSHMGWVWIIPSNFRHNRDATIPQVWGDNTSDASTLPHVMVRGHSFLTAGTNGTSYREEGGGIYRGTNNIFNLSGFRIFGAANSNPHVPASNGSGNGYVRIYRFRSGLETRE